MGSGIHEGVTERNMNTGTQTEIGRQTATARQTGSMHT